MRGDQAHEDWRKLWRDYGPRLLLFARQQTPHLADAEDLVQEAFVRYWRAREKDSTLTPGLMFTMVRRIAIDHARRNGGRVRREIAAGMPEESAAVWFADPVETQERREMLEEALRSLPQTQREVLVLKIWGGLTFEQVGDTLDIPANTAASRYRYALGQLRQTLSPALL